jgi:hypothetical protein
MLVPHIILKLKFSPFNELSLIARGRREQGQKNSAYSQIIYISAGGYVNLPFAPSAKFPIHISASGYENLSNTKLAHPLEYMSL